MPQRGGSVAKRLTEKAIIRLGTKPQTYWVFDAKETGLGLKITPAGSKIWVLELRYPGHTTQSRRTLGTYPSLGLTAARAKAAQWYGWAKQGVDPADAEQAEHGQGGRDRRARGRKRREN